MVFAGVGVALVTLFDDHGGLDLRATAAHARRAHARRLVACDR